MFPQRKEKKWAKEMDINSITIDNLYGEQYEIAALIGIEAYKKLVMNYGGGSVYICKPDTIMKADRNREICEKFNGYNYRELSKEYNLSKKTIRSITAVKLKELKNAPIDGQLKL